MPRRRTILTSATMMGASLTALAHPVLAAPRRAPAKAAAPSTPPAPPPTPATTPIGPFGTVVQQAFMADFDTGAVLLEKNADVRMHPSSLTKLVTLYVVFEQLKKGSLKLDQTLPVSRNAWKMGGSKMFVQLGTSIAVQDLLQGVIVDSGNDACIVLAEGIAGSEQQFTALMTDVAKRLGMTNSTFRNATGWPDPNHLMTARDIFTVAHHLISDFPEYFHFFSQQSFTWDNITQQNRDPLLGRVPGADGMKTGHTDEGGYGLCGTVKRGDRRVILVFNGAPTSRSRIEEGQRIMEWAYSEFENVTLFKAADTVQDVPVYLGDRRTVPLVGGRDVIVTLPRGWRQNLQAKLSYQSPIPAPILKGDKLGEIQVSGQGVPNISLPLLAGADVGKLGLVSRIPAVVTQWVAGI